MQPRQGALVDVLWVGQVAHPNEVAAHQRVVEFPEFGIGHRQPLVRDAPRKPA